MFKDFEEALENASQAVIDLRSEAESIMERMEAIIESCETIEADL